MDGVVSKAGETLGRRLGQCFHFGTPSFSLLLLHRLAVASAEAAQNSVIQNASATGKKSFLTYWRKQQSVHLLAVAAFV